jgi:hypothetical protein
MHILFPAFQLDVQPVTTPLTRSNFALKYVPYILATVGLSTVMRLCTYGLLDTHFTADGYGRQAESESATPFLGACAKLRNATITSAIHPSARPNGITRLPLDGF